MMTTDAIPTGLSGLLPQILGGLGDSGVLLDAAGGDEFVQSLAGQIKSLMLQRGDDPAAVAAIDDMSLVTHFFALVQDQTESPGSGLSILGRLGTLIEGTETPADAQDAESLADEEPSSASDTNFLAGLAALPTVVLERLSAAGRILPTETPEQSLAGAAESVDLEGLAPALSRQATPSTTLGGEVSEALSEAAMDKSSPSLPSWLARQLASGDSSRESALDAVVEVVRETGESAEPAPTAAPRMPTTATETPTLGARPQTLDLNRLLQPGGETRLAEQIRWSVDQGLDTAEIRLHPPSLGALDVRIVQEGDKTHVQFVSAHPVAREVLEAAMPRLREALAQDGVWLGNVSVSDQAPRDGAGTGRDSGASAETGDPEVEDDEERIETRGTIAVLSRRLDVFT